MRWIVAAGKAVERDVSLDQPDGAVRDRVGLGVMRTSPHLTDLSGHGVD